ncbi:MAG: tetratricopeptide repeat protein [Pseudomonadota bacterium]|nr:tetratricopeptide repeat protein [Pseudomonadota bacterium]
MVTPMNRHQRRQAKRVGRQKEKKEALAVDPRLRAARKAHEAGRYLEASSAYKSVLIDEPRNPEALHFSGLLCYQQGQSEEAEELLRKAIRVRPGVTMFHANLANVLQFVGKNDLAEIEYKKAIRLDPSYINAYLHYSVLLSNQQRFEEAESMARRADSLQPDKPETLNLLATIARQIGDLSAAEKLLHRVFEVDPNFEKAYSNLIFVSDFKPNISFYEQQSLRRRWADRFAAPLLPVNFAFSNEPDPEKRLRIGYVSGDFRAHSAQSAFGGVIFERDRSSFEVYCYMTSANADSITERYKASADKWRPCWGMNEKGLADKIRSDQIDILLDLSGHSEGGKLLTFARKPAPIQITAWGHCTGTGMPAMDYFFADELIVLSNESELCAEEIVNLSCCLSYMTPTEAPDVAESPVLTNGYVTFGYFNRIEKISIAALDTWSQILNSVEGSRLLMKHVALEQEAVADELRDRLMASRIDLSRVDFMGRTKWFAHLQALEKVDIALDPFPNNGGVTTLETLWMGVPLVTLSGATPASRIAGSIVTAGGHGEWVAGTPEEYVAIAKRLAGEPLELQNIRRSLRPALEKLPLGNAKLYAQEVEGHYRRLWRIWCGEGVDRDYSLERANETAEQDKRKLPQQVGKALTEIMQSAVRLHEAGQVDEAVALYDRALATAPDEPEILHMKGVALAQSGDIDSGIGFIRQAISLKDDSVDFHNNLAVFLREINRLDEAAAALRRAIEIAPGHMPAYGNLAAVFESAGRHDEAAEVCRKAIHLDPENAQLHHTLGLQLEALGHSEAAAAALRRAAELAPRSPEVHNNLGNVLMEIGDYESAESSFKEAVCLRDDYALAWQNLGSLLVKMWRLDEAISSFNKALSNDPKLVQAHVNLAAALNLREKQEEAASVARKAITLAPETAEAYNNLGVALRSLGDYAGAEAAYRRVIELDPRHAKGHSNFIFTLDFNKAYNIYDHQAERRRWDKMHAAPLAEEIKHHCNEPNPDRKLRIGYVSADFRRHSAMNGFGPMIHNFDRDRFDVICYASNVLEDEVTEALRDSASEWRRCSRESHERLARRIREDSIDILVDLSGHSAGNRLLVFARKPAPIQVHAWGYANGTGLAAMDYFFTDPIVVPENEHDLYVETVRYIPSHLPYLPPQNCPEPLPSPFERSGIFSFGSFNRLEKFSDAALRSWSEILLGAPTSRLVVKSQALDRPGIIEKFSCRLEAAGIDCRRVELLGSDPQPEHLAKHGLVDLMLDPFPHAGGISAADALWMGVPLVSLNGNIASGRVGASALHAIDLDELIANDTNEYVDIAVRLARSPGRLAELRASMRSRVLASSMGNAKRYVEAVEKVYSDIWRDWCEAQPRF